MIKPVSCWCTTFVVNWPTILMVARKQRWNFAHSNFNDLLPPNLRLTPIYLTLRFFDEWPLGQILCHLHITPQSENACASSYVSFENESWFSPVSARSLGTAISAVFLPSAGDTIRFNTDDLTQGFLPIYALGRGSLTTEQGYDISFSHYQQLEALKCWSPEFMYEILAFV